MYLSQEHHGRKIRTFRLSEEFISTFKNTQPDWGPVGYFTYKRTYARQLEDGSLEEYWQTCRRVVEGVYNIQKQHCRALTLPWDDRKAQTSAQEMFERIWNFKFTPPGRGLWMMGTDLIYLKGGAALNNCFAAETEFITDKGVLNMKDSLGEEINVLCPDNTFRKATVNAFGKQELFKVTLKPKGLRTNLTHTILVTKNHRWLLDGEGGNIATTRLQVGDTLRPLLKKQAVQETNCTAFAHGLIFGDGTRHTYYPERHSITICDGREDEYIPLLKQVEGFVSVTGRTEGQPYPVVTIVRKGENWKTLPFDKDENYIAGFIKGWLCADSWLKPSGSVCLDTQSREAAEWLIKNAPLAGYTAVGHGIDDSETNFGKRSAPLQRISLTPKEVNFVVTDIQRTGRLEEVYCVTQPETQEFVLSGGIPTGNCAFVTTENLDVDFAQPFCFLMDMSMFGVGVGSDTRGTGKVKIQVPKTTTKTYVVDDSREGWVELLRTILNSFVGKGHYPLNIDYSNVREMGSPIKGFGGVASGPGPLIELVKNITELLWPEDNEPYWIKSSQIVDLHNMVGVCVVSGGVRRTAEIMFGHYNDDSFRKLKDPSELNEWGAELYALSQKESLTEEELNREKKLSELVNKHPLRTHRWASNNSIFADVGMNYEEIADSIASNGEPGILWLDNVRAYGRMVDPPSWKDIRALGSNPCSEQSLEDEELCCLVETFPARHDSFEDFQRTLKFAYLYAKTVTLIPTHNPKTNQVMGRNRRIGCSQSGIQQAKTKLGRREYFKWCDEGYDYIASLDKLYSEWLCVPRSIKTTSVKPSGTVSLLCGATPGIHYPHSEYYIRNIRVQEGSPLIQACIDAGYPVERDVYSSTSFVVSFPVKEENFTKSKDDVTIWEQFADAADMQRYWADNQVSVTVTFTEEEKKHIKTCLEMYEDKMKSVSLLPLIDHGYAQAPYITITKDKYEELVSSITKLDLSFSVHEATDMFCDGEACEIRFDTDDN